MTLKKILAAASALVIGAAMAVPASADTVSVELDNDKIMWGDPEDKGTLRLELFNAYGGTKLDAPFTTSDIANASSITVTFTLTGAPDGEYNASIYFADGSWTITDDHTGSTTINGDGTYSVTTGDFGMWDEESPKLANSATVLVVDIFEMGEAAGVSQEDDYDMSVVTISDVSIEFEAVEEEPAEEEPAEEEADAPEAEEPESVEEQGTEEEADEDDGDAAESSEAEEENDNDADTPPATADTVEEEQSGMSTGAIVGIVVGCVAVIGVIAAVVLKKKK